MENQNDVFAEFAATFVGSIRADSDIAFPSELERKRLDYSIASLKDVDAYLALLHVRRIEWHGPEWINTVLWGGAYVGEVIRSCADRQYDWIDFDDFVAEYPATVELLGPKKELGICALLSPGGGAFTLPINKMIRFIHEGPADSVWFYADCEVRAR